MTDWTIKGKPELVILHMQEGIVGKSSHIPSLYEAVKKKGLSHFSKRCSRAFDIESCQWSM